MNKINFTHSLTTLFQINFLIMKKYLFLYLCLLSCSVEAQVKPNITDVAENKGLKVNNGLLELDTAFINNRYVRQINTIDELRSYTGKITNGTRVHVAGYRRKDDRGGGNYIWSDTSKIADDGGAIIRPDGISKDKPGRYIYDVKDGVVNLKWWGIRSGDDITDEIAAAEAFMKHSKIGVLYIPSDTTLPRYYNYTGTWIVDNSMTIRGDAVLGKWHTRIQWPTNTKCIFIPYKNSLGGINSTRISDIEIFQAFNTVYDSSAHGIHTRSVVSLNNVFVSFAGGDGFRIEGCQIVGNQYEGQTGFSELNNCAANFTNNGLFIIGCDANEINIYKFNASAIRRWGSYDDGFLGNTYISPHFAFCGSGMNQPVVIRYPADGQYYAAISPEDVINKGFRPDLYPQYWEPVGDMGSGYAWNETTRYWSGGPYNTVNTNAKTLMIDPYFEGYQPNARNSQGTMSLNGTRGAGIKGGIDLSAGNAGLTINTTVNLTSTEGGLVINSPSATFQSALALKSLYGYTPTVFHESTGHTVSQRFKNSNNNAGYFEYSHTDFKFYANDVNSATIKPNGLSTIKLFVTETGTAASAGTASLSGGTVTVKTSSVLSTSKVYLTVKSPGGTQGFLSTPVIANGSFTIRSTSSNETSSVNWWVIN